MLTIVGLGVKEGDLSERAKQAILQAELVLVRTELAVSAKSLKNLSVPYTALDYLYEKSRSFETLKNNMVKEIKTLSKGKNTVYLVDGSVSEDVVSLAIREKEDVQVIDGISKSSHFAARANLAGYTALSAYDVENFKRTSLPLVVYDIDSRELASNVKLFLANLVGEESEILFYHEEEEKKMCLYEMDREAKYDYTTAIVVKEPPFLTKERYDYTDLEDLIKLLRAPGGCPWDRAQTNMTIRTNLVEEAYELVDAIEAEDDDHIREETGDVLLQAAFHAVIKEEEGVFNSEDAITDLCKKLIFRHSHIFGKDKANDDAEALGVWDKNKKLEKGQKTFSDAVLDVPKAFPALMRAQKVGKRAGKSGLDFASAEKALESAKAEMVEFLDAYKSGNKEQTIEELGDVLFSVVNAGRLAGVDTEFALKGTVDKFVKRFVKTEELVLADGKQMENMTEEELDVYYRRAKEACKHMN